MHLIIGLNGFDGWSTINGGNGWAISDAYTRAGNKKCFASSYAWDELEYNKDLKVAAIFIDFIEIFFTKGNFYC